MEAVDLLAQHQPDAMLVAGGTDLYPGMKRGIFEPKKLVSLRRLAELKKFGAHNGLTLGAGLTLSQIATHPLIISQYPALAIAAEAVSTPQLRNMGTIGGNLCLDTRCNYYNQSDFWRDSLGYCLKKPGAKTSADSPCICWVAPGSSHCWAVQSSDVAPVMIALGARVCLVGPNGARQIPVEALYNNDGIAYLNKAPDEILTEIELPPAHGVRMTYQKLRRRGSFDFPVLSVAVALHQNEEGVCTAANVILGAVASAPVRATEAEALLVGEKLTPEVIEATAKKAYQPAKPLDNTDMSIAYRKQMARVYVARALQAVSQN